MPDDLPLPSDSPTVAGRWLAGALKQLRLDQGVTRARVAQELGCVVSKIGHIETQYTPVRKADLLVMLQIYKVPPEKQVWYLDMCERAKQKGWWDGAPGIPDWFSAFIGLEWGAARIHNFEIGVIPGLLQTPEYMSVLFREDQGQDIEPFVDQRRQRQLALDRTDHPLELEAIIDEGALRRMVGDTDVMRGQLRHLIQLADHPRVSIRIVPFSAGGHAGFGGSFHCLDFASPHDPGVIYLETRCGGLFLEEPTEIAEYRAVFDRIAAKALAPVHSVTFVRRLLEELS